MKQQTTFEITEEDMRQFEAWETEVKRLRGITVTERENLIRDVFETELLPMLRAKGHDYSGNANSFGNLSDFGWQGVVVRLGDKYHRLKNFAKAGELKVKDESIEDTLKDMINYAFFCLIMRRQGL